MCLGACRSVTTEFLVALNLLEGSRCWDACDALALNLLGGKRCKSCEGSGGSGRLELFASWLLLPKPLAPLLERKL